ncbi:hypothetical protein [Bacillus pseudomycoides]|uniref:hypothetical protein n=1 Tax=Bacillus pseudomycoides TaxID=64104 RepID=UPI000BF22448|nr:hypothetical protein [Bacillus pseudomycoides]PEI44613.1 hypothetical protein CN641_15905 [Bacillus pseudomycoides]PFY13891.1 hypothetical protein COL42_20485 [Bacillus pseudomycoides]
MEKLAKEFLEIAKDVFERQSTATPCIYYFNGKFDFSRGDTLGGTAMVVHNGEAEIVKNTEYLAELTNEWEYDFDTAVEILTESLEDFVSEKEES